jgi:small subunit ribosomal protein S6
VRPYEIMIIFDASLEEESVRRVRDRVTEVVRSHGGTPGRVDRWGKRRFAYELSHRWEGNYVLFEATAEPAAMDEAHRVLTLADEVLRHKVVRLPEGTPAQKRGPVAVGATKTAEAGD